MVKRQLSNGNLLPSNRTKPFDHAITAVLLICLSTFGLALGGTMTGLAFGYEKRTGFSSVAEGYNFRCDIAGIFLLITGGVGILVAFVLISVFGVCSKPQWSTCEISPTIPSVGIEVDGK